eukprot:jgi/Ulvmu1/5353/UM022_0147.1
MAPSTAFSTKPVFQYLNLRPLAPVGGRGGALRLYMLANKVPFEEKLIELDLWQNGEKKRIQEEVNPMGHLPVLTVDGKDRAETVATMRYVATKIGQYGKDADADWDSDAAADAYQEWRNGWASLLDVGSDSPLVAEYLGRREEWYAAMDWYYSKRSAQDTPFLSSGAQPGIADAAIFNMVRDDRLFHGAVDLAPYPHLAAAVQAFGSIAEVADWIKAWEAHDK